jgi:hypothetical protein
LVFMNPCCAPRYPKFVTRTLWRYKILYEGSFT